MVLLAGTSERGTSGGPYCKHKHLAITHKESSLFKPSEVWKSSKIFAIKTYKEWNYKVDVKEQEQKQYIQLMKPAVITILWKKLFYSV